MTKPTTIFAQFKAAYQAEVAARGRQYQDSMDAALSSVANWLSARPQTGLLISGDIGTGKSTLLQAIRQVLNAYGLPWCFLPMYRAQSVFKGADDFDDWCATKHMIMLDDVGIEPDDMVFYGNRINIFPEIIYRRYDNRCPLIITTNLDSRQIEERYGRRVADRMEEMFAKVVLKGESFRKFK